jgi:hypothetical protein
MPRILFPLLVAVLLSGCMVGPDYVRPSAPAPVPDAYREMAGWKRAEPRDAIERGRWWEMFGDPELNALAARVEISNQNIRVAEANFRQAQALAEQARAGLFPTVGAGASAIRSKSPSLSNQPSFASGAVNNFNLNLNAAGSSTCGARCAGDRVGRGELAGERPTSNWCGCRAGGARADYIAPASPTPSAGPRGDGRRTSARSGSRATAMPRGWLPGSTWCRRRCS